MNSIKSRVSHGTGSRQCAKQVELLSLPAWRGWAGDNSHLHEFEIAGENYGMPDPDGWGPTVNPEARKTLIKALNGKRKFNYLYDFGDSWHHRIKVEKTLPAIACPQVPYCIDGANDCPPEDVGAGLVTRIFWRRWPTQIIQSMTQWLS